MTAVGYRPNVRRTQVTPYTAERRIVGTPAQVASTVDQVRRSGRLVAMTHPRLLPEGDGRVYVNVRYLATPNRSARRVADDRRRTALRTAGRTALVVVPVTGLAAALVYALALLVADLVHLLPYAGVGVVAALLVRRAFSRAGVCAGRHCPGCSHRGHR